MNVYILVYWSKICMHMHICSTMQALKMCSICHTCYRIAVEAMRALSPGVVTMALNNALWSVEEEAVLARIPSVS